MTAAGWLSRSLADVPPGDGWLSDAEREVLAGLHVEKRRADWRLGRWTAKEAVARRLAIPPGRIEILAAGDGAPEAHVGGAPAPLCLSLSHRAGRSVAAVADTPVGCDLELIEPRSAAFLGDWLAPAEQELVARSRDAALTANLIWTAKEAAAKVVREGLRLDVRSASVTIGDADADADAQDGWRPLGVSLLGREIAGWWRRDGDFVLTVAGDGGPPRAL